jgi:hypothetical protein
MTEIALKALVAHYLDMGRGHELAILEKTLKKARDRKERVLIMIILQGPASHILLFLANVWEVNEGRTMSILTFAKQKRRSEDKKASVGGKLRGSCKCLSSVLRQSTCCRCKCRSLDA